MNKIRDAVRAPLELYIDIFRDEKTWWDLPLEMRQRWWDETDFGRKSPSDDLVHAIKNELKGAR